MTVEESSLWMVMPRHMQFCIQQVHIGCKSITVKELPGSALFIIFDDGHGCNDKIPAFQEKWIS
jgi:hypothetical protein